MLRVVCQAGRGIWLREHKPSQPEVNAWEVGILLNNLAIFLLGVIPFPLRFVGLSQEFVRFRRRSTVQPELLRGARGQIGEGMNLAIENSRILRKLMRQELQELQRRVAPVERHRTVQAS